MILHRGGAKTQRFLQNVLNSLPHLETELNLVHNGPGYFCLSACEN